MYGPPSNRVTVLQSFMFAVYTEASQNIQNATGPIDDGYITNVVGALPGDALCCSGPEKLDDGMPQAVSAFLPNGYSGLAAFVLCTVSEVLCMGLASYTRTLKPALDCFTCLPTYFYGMEVKACLSHLT